MEVYSGEYRDFNTFAKDLLQMAWTDYQQDAILIKYPDKAPVYYDCKTRCPIGSSFSSTTLNDITKEYFTALKSGGTYLIKMLTVLLRANRKDLLLRKHI